MYDKQMLWSVRNGVPSAATFTMFTLSSVSAVKQASYSKRSQYNHEAVEKRERQRNTAETHKRGGYQHRKGIRLSHGNMFRRKPAGKQVAMQQHVKTTPIQGKSHGLVFRRVLGVLSITKNDNLATRRKLPAPQPLCHGPTS